MYVIPVTSSLLRAALTFVMATLLVACGTDSIDANDGDSSGNRAPVANDMAVDTTPNTVVSGMLAASDADGDSLTFNFLVTIPDLSEGTIELTDPTTGAFTYTPGPGQTAIDTFDFVANDGQVDSNIAALTIAVISPATGVWIGSLISDVNQQNTEVTGIIAHNNEARIIGNSGVQYVGSLDVQDDVVSGALTGYAAPGSSFPDGSTVAAFDIDGSLLAGNALSGSYSGAGDSGTFFFDYESVVSERTSSLDNLSGTWSATDLSGVTITVNVDSDGLISGSDTNGCMYNGNANILMPSFNIYQLDIAVASCVERDGSYAGLATAVNSDDVPQIRCLACDGLLIFGVSNAGFSVTGTLKK